MLAASNKPLSPTSCRSTPASPSSKAKVVLSPQLKLRTGEPSSSYYANDDLQSKFVQEFLSYEQAKQERTKNADLRQFISLPESAVHPQAQHQLVRQAKCNKKSSSNKSTALRSTTPRNNDRQRLAELSKALHKKTSKGKPYVEVNTKLMRVLQHMKPRGKRAGMQAKKLNDFYLLVTRETSAAIVLQSQCRRVLATEYVNDVRLRTKQATKIQCCIRGFFARELLKRLKDEMQRATVIRERFVRLYVARYQRRKRIKLEHNSAVVCQSAIRMFFAKQVAQTKRLQKSWELNQQRWVTISIRLSWADLRINFYAREIQSIVRRKLAQKRVSSLFTEHTNAAISIQRIWRGFVAKKNKVDIIYQLTVDQHCDKIRIIASEHRYWREIHGELTKPTRLQTKNDFCEQRQDLERQRLEKYEQIHALELHLKDQLQIQEQITPRAILGGWEEQIQINLKDTRERITNAKLDLFFDIEKKLKSVNDEITHIQSIENEARVNFDHWSTWKDVEQEKLWNMQRQHDNEVEEKMKRQSIIDEQLRWAVSLCVPSGKPDKRKPLHHHRQTRDYSEDRAHEQLDDLRALNHLANTFLPFQNLMNSCNSLDTNAFQTKATKSMRVEPHTHSIRKERYRKKEPTRDFRKKLPWNLLDKVKEEREEIRAKFEATG